jgi:serine/threonine protein phosphatase PrpC
MNWIAEKWQDGSTALVAMVANGRVVVANAGDCRGVHQWLLVAFRHLMSDDKTLQCAS